MYSFLPKKFKFKNKISEFNIIVFKSCNDYKIVYWKYTIQYNANLPKLNKYVAKFISTLSLYIIFYYYCKKMGYVYDLKSNNRIIYNQKL